MNKGHRIGFRDGKNPADTLNSEVGKLSFSMLARDDELDLNKAAQPVDTSRMTPLQRQYFGVTNRVPLVNLPGLDPQWWAPGSLCCNTGPDFLTISYDASNTNLLIYKTTDFVTWQTGTIPWATSQFIGNIMWTGSEYLVFCYDASNTKTFGMYSANGLTGWTQFTISTTAALQTNYGIVATTTKIVAIMHDDSNVITNPLVITKPLSASPTMSTPTMTAPIIGFRVTSLGPSQKGMIVDNAYYTEDMSSFTKVLEKGWYVDAAPIGNQLYMAYRQSFINGYTKIATSPDGLTWTRTTAVSPTAVTNNRLYRTSDATGKTLYVNGYYMSYDLKHWTVHDSSRQILGSSSFDTFIYRNNVYTLTEWTYPVISRHDFSQITSSIMPTQYASYAKLRIK